MTNATQTKYERVRQAIQSDAWLILPEKLALIADIINEASFESLKEVQPEAAQPGYINRRGKMSLTEDGIATINIVGPMMRYANMFEAISGATSTEMMRNEFEAAMKNPDVKGILLNIDSPGGQASGIAEFAEIIQSAKGKKPVIAYASGLAASAAYWIASAADQIITDPTAYVGSIGVVVSWLDATDYYARQGVYERKIVSSQSPMKHADPRSETGSNAMQKRIDALAAEFINTVARNRGITTEKVQADFGQGDVLIGTDAVRVGMVDQVGYFADAMRRLREKCGLDGGGYTRVSSPGLQVPTTPATALDETITSEVIDMSEKTQAVPDADLQAMQARLATLEAEKAEQEALATAQAAKLAEFEQKLAAESQKTAELQNKARLERYRLQVTGKAEGAIAFAGDTEKHVAVMDALATTLGEDSAEFKFYVESNKAVAAQLKDSKLFESMGSDADGQGDGSSAAAQLDSLAKAHQKANPTLTYAQAYTAILEANPELYKQYQQEKGGR